MRGRAGFFYNRAQSVKKRERKRLLYNNNNALSSNETDALITGDNGSKFRHVGGKGRKCIIAIVIGDDFRHLRGAEEHEAAAMLGRQ